VRADIYKKQAQHLDTLRPQAQLFVQVFLDSTPNHEPL
jgi:hypothetical protein